MNDYEHRQIAKVSMALMISGAGISGVTAVINMVNMSMLHFQTLMIVCVVFVLCTLGFSTLTVKVSRASVVIKFGVGIISKTFAVADIETAAIVRNRWYYGWGIRLTPHGWLYNVSGLDAVEIQLENGRKYRIGTDESCELFSAIERVILQK